MTVTGTLPEQLSEGDARRLTQQIRLLTGSIADQVDRVISLIAQAEVGRAWDALGYQSHNAYCAQEFAGALPRLDRQARQELVGSLTEAGMSTRAIAPIAGVDHATVARDQGRVANATPDAADECDPDAEIVDAELIDDDRPAPKPITGVDGKNYNRPEPKPLPVKPTGPGRSPFNRDFYADVEKVRKAINALAKTTQDDRSPGTRIRSPRHTAAT